MDDNFLVIDILAHEYGWSIEYIQKLQVTEINSLIKVINDRKWNEYLALCYIINCAVAGKQPSLAGGNSPKKDTKDVSQMPEDMQLIQLMKAIGGTVERRK